MERNKMKRILSGLDTALHKEKLDEKALSQLLREWSSFGKGYFDDTKDVSFAYKKLSCMSENLDEERVEIVKKFFVVLLKKTIGDKNCWLCPFFFQQADNDIKLPFETWYDEINAICSDGIKRELDVEELYYVRCCRCKMNNCPYRIIRPDNNGPYWRQSEYKQQHQELQEQPLANETRQQKAARTRTEECTRILHPILPDICKKLIEKSLVITDRGTGKFKFLGTIKEYAYFAFKLEKETKLPCKPWKVLENYIIPPDTTQGNLKKEALYFKYHEDKRPRRASAIDSAIDEVLHQR